MPSFNAISRKYTKILLLAQEKYKFCKQGGKLDYSRYSQVHVSLLTLCYHWQSFIWGATNIYTVHQHRSLYPACTAVQDNN